MKRDDSPSAELVSRFRSQVIGLAEQSRFIHHTWYVEYHLKIVEKIATELADIYTEADNRLVSVLVWLHDYGKLINREREHELTVIEGRRTMVDMGFTPAFTDRAVECVQLLDNSRNVDLTKASIEVRIVSSADGCAHFAGPFFQIWLWENSERPLHELMQENRRKAEKDWWRKIVLPEARTAFEERYRLICEQNGDLPGEYIQKG